MAVRALQTSFIVADRRRCWERITIACLMVAAAGTTATAAAAECAARMQRALAKVTAAQRRTVDACVDRLDTAAPGFSAADCIASDAFGWVARAAARAKDAEARLCTGPSVGYTSAAAVTAAGIGTATAVTRGLFGRDLDATLRTSAADPIGARCQREVGR